MPILNSIGALSLEEGGDNSSNPAITGYIKKVVPNYDGTVVLIARERFVEIYERDSSGIYSVALTVNPPDITQNFVRDCDISSDGKKFVVSFWQVADNSVAVGDKITIIYAYSKTTTWTLNRTINANAEGKLDLGNSISLSWADTGCVITQAFGTDTTTGNADGFVYYYGNIWSNTNRTLLPRVSAVVNGQHTWPRQALITNNGNYVRVASGLSFVNADDISVSTKLGATIPATTKFHQMSCSDNVLNREYKNKIFSGDGNVQFDVYNGSGTTVPALGTTADIRKVIITYGVGSSLVPTIAGTNVSKFTYEWFDYGGQQYSMVPYTPTPFAKIIDPAGLSEPTYSASGLPPAIRINSTTGDLIGQGIFGNRYPSDPLGRFGDKTTTYTIPVTATFDGGRQYTHNYELTLKVLPLKKYVPSTTVYAVAPTSDNPTNFCNLFYIHGGGIDGYDHDTLYRSIPRTLTVSPPLPSGMTVSSFTGSYDGVTLTYNNTITVGNYTHTFTIVSPNGESVSETITINIFNPAVLSHTETTTAYKLNKRDTAISITPTTITDELYSLRYSATLPNGLSINPTTGVISGTITTGAQPATSYTITVEDVYNSAETTSDIYYAWYYNSQNYRYKKIGPYQNTIVHGSVTVPFTIEIFDISVTTLAYDPNIIIAVPAKAIPTLFTVSPSGGATPYTYSISPALPAGLTLNTSTGGITGTPTAKSATTSYTMSITDSRGNTATATILLSVSWPAVVLTPATAYKFEKDLNKTVNLLSTTGGSGSGYVYSISPALPSGLTLNTSTGTIGGTATSLYTAAQYVLTVTDSKSNTATANITLSVDYQTLIIYLNSPPRMTKGEAITNTRIVSGGGGSGGYVYSISPALPSGLSFDTATGILSGTPTVAMTTATYNVTVTDSRNISVTSTTTMAVWNVLTLTLKSYIPDYVVGTVSAPLILTTTTGGSGGNKYSILPALPSGITLNTTTGAIGGTAATVSSATYTITVTDDTNKTASVSVVLNSLYPGFGISSTFTEIKLINGATVNTNSSVVTPVGGSGKSLTYSISPALPAGLSISSTTGIISGTPTTTQTVTSYTVTANDAAAVTSNTATIKISIAAAPVAITKYSGVNILVSISTITPINPTSAIYSISPSLPTGLNINATSGIISGYPTTTKTATVYTVTMNDSINTVTQSVTIGIITALTVTNTFPKYLTKGIPAAGTYVSVSGGSGFYTYSISGTIPSGMNWVSNSGSFTGTPNTVGSNKFTVVVKDSYGWNTGDTSPNNWYVESLCQSQTYDELVLTGSNQVFYTGTSYSTIIINATGGVGPLSYSISPTLPAGLTFNSGAVISGTPTSVMADTTYTFTCQDNATSITKKVTVTLAVRTPISLSYTSPSNLAIGSTASIKPNISGGTLPYTYSVSPTLPTGLNISASTGTIAGVATTASALSQYTVTVTDNKGDSKTTSLQIAVFSAVSIRYAQTSYIGTMGGAMSIAAPTISGGSGSGYVYSISPGVPAGLTLNTSTGAITGTPTAGSNSGTFTITATNSVTGLSGTASFTMNILAGSATVVNKNNTTTYTVTPTVIGGTTPYSYSLSLSTRPTGTTGTISSTGVATITKGSTNGTFSGNIFVSDKSSPVRVIGISFTGTF